VVVSATKRTLMLQRAEYDRYDPKLLEQMYRCPESDLSYDLPAGPEKKSCGMRKPRMLETTNGVSVENFYTNGNLGLSLYEDPKPPKG
ncbi:hypothetical protein X777_07755, partial [Ooceraea biroi]